MLDQTSALSVPLLSVESVEAKDIVWLHVICKDGKIIRWVVGHGVPQRLEHAKFKVASGEQRDCATVVQKAGTGNVCTEKPGRRVRFQVLLDEQDRSCLDPTAPRP